MSTTQPTYDDILRLFKETDEKFKETDLRFKETDKKFKETERFLKEVSSSVGKLGNRLGEFIEDAVRPAAVRLFQERGIVVHEVQQNVTVQRGEEGLEIDLMVVNDSEAVAVECKSNLKIDDVNEHLERLGKLKRLLPRYANFKVTGAVAAMVIADNVARYAASKGLFVIGQSGDDMAIRNDDDFTPTIW
jgi:hypothetical protein